MTVLYSGCSFTAGVGWGSGWIDEKGQQCFNDCKHSKHLWVNLLHNRLFFDTPLDNIATGGNSNLRIFQTTATALLTSKYSHAFVQWTSPMRYEWSAGLETWNTTIRSCAGSKQRTINLHNNVSYPGYYVQECFDRFILLEHEHYRLVQLIEYINILNRIAELTNTHIYFINGICKWDKDFFTRLDPSVPSDTTAYTQELIDLENRNDKDYKILYNKMHNEYQKAGTILEDKWLNLYESMDNNIIDRNNDKSHAGIQSNKNFTSTFLQALKTKS
jgi:hypothetical protein